jgi:hypothetical protein
MTVLPEDRIFAKLSEDIEDDAAVDDQCSASRSDGQESHQRPKPVAEHVSQRQTEKEVHAESS